jgi:hypothetical protein
MCLFPEVSDTSGQRCTEILPYGNRDFRKYKGYFSLPHVHVYVYCTLVALPEVTSVFPYNVVRRYERRYNTDVQRTLLASVLQYIFLYYYLCPGVSCNTKRLLRCTNTFEGTVPSYNVHSYIVHTYLRTYFRTLSSYVVM